MQRVLAIARLELSDPVRRAFIPTLDDRGVNADKSSQSKRQAPGSTSSMNCLWDEHRSFVSCYSPELYRSTRPSEKATQVACIKLGGLHNIT